MGFMDKLKGMVNPDDVDDGYEDDYVFDGNENEGDYEDFQQPQPARMQQNQGYAPQRQQPMQPQSGGMSLNSANLELKVVKPEKYDSITAQKIADHLLNRRTVVLNLELTNKESARRLIDFLSGVAYSIDGYIQRVANNTFVIVPNNVDVSGEQINDQPQQQRPNASDLF